MDSRVTTRAQGVSDHPALETAARIGYAASGVLHLLIGWIALQLAWSGRSAENADQSGAMASLASNPLGTALLWVAAAGLLGLGLLSLLRAAAGSREHDTGDRIKDAAKGVVYLAMAWPAITFARGGSSSSKEQTTDFTASLLEAPGGKLLVMALGLGLVAIGGYHAYKGWTRKFLEDLEQHPGQAATYSGQVGYLAKGLALGVLGVLFIVGGSRGSAKGTGGLDAALRTLLEQPFGRILLTAVALGFVAYAVYSFFRARHAKL